MTISYWKQEIQTSNKQGFQSPTMTKHKSNQTPIKTKEQLKQQVQQKEQQKHQKQQQQQQKQQQQQQQQQQQEQKKKDESGPSSKDEEIASLRQQLQALQGRLEAVEAQVAVTSKVNSILSKEVDRLEQYGRRNSVVIRGILPKEDETNDQLKQCVEDIVAGDLGFKEQFKVDFDKTHRIGPVLDTPKGKRQDVIVRFKSHSTRYDVYHKRKSLKNKSIRITPSLTKTRRKLLSTARSEYEEHEDVDFIYVNEHGDTKVRFEEKFRGKYAYDFASIDELRELMETPFGKYESDEEEV